jgi:hypothetical protein
MLSTTPLDQATQARTQVIMNIPFTAIHFSAYETMKRLLDQSGDEETLATQLLAGGTAGAASAACTNPLDVVKTRLQTDGMLQHRRHLHSGDVVRCGFCALCSGLCALCSAGQKRSRLAVP